MSRFWKSFHREALNKTTMCECTVGCMPDGCIPKELLYGELDALDANYSCDTEMLWGVTWMWVLTQRPGKTSQLIRGHNGEEPWPSTSKQEKRSWHKPPQRSGPAESFVSALSNRQHTHATLASRTAIHASVFAVIVADAPAKHTTWMLYPWSTLTDGGLLCTVGFSVLDSDLAGKHL